MYTMTGADLTIRLLERQGIETISGIPGGANLPLYDALYGSDKIRHVLARHEQGAGFIAQGMARASGLPQVCFATSGPGATNVLTAIADAKLDSVPVICITGQVPSSMIGSDAFQEVDTYGLSIPITKHNFLVRDVAELLETIPAAFRIASSGRPGPVLIDIPKDIQTQEISFEQWPEPGRPTQPSPANPEDLQQAAAMINQAQRPILYLGGGTIISNASEQARTLMERSSLPTTMTLMGLGAVPVDHELSLGMLGMHAAPYTNMALEACDLLIAVGARFDDRATGKVSAFCPNAKVIHIDIDPSELDKIKQAHIGIIGDVKQVLEQLTPMISDNRRTQWTTEVENLRRTHPFQTPKTDRANTAYGAIRKVAELVDDNAIVTTDVGQHQMRTAQLYPFRKPRRWLTSGGLGTMGFGLPAAIGAALAEPDNTVICFTGDGSLMMNIQELATAIEQQTNIKIILMNNNALGLVHQQQTMFYGKRTFASDYELQMDFVAIARGFGMPTFDLSGNNNHEALLREALEYSGPCLIHIPIDVNENVFPMVPPGAANIEMIGGDDHV
ncbi:MAG: acetolactate synthase large subunit [Gammaproteobacteria bacterium]|nr:acetolactate synthase large subunit [Gammaproteobacteria bacterium]